MQMLTQICRKSESSLSFRLENTVTEGTNLRPIKAVCRDECFHTLAQIDKLSGSGLADKVKAVIALIFDIQVS